MLLFLKKKLRNGIKQAFECFSYSSVDHPAQIYAEMALGLTLFIMKLLMEVTINGAGWAFSPHKNQLKNCLH